MNDLNGQYIVEQIPRAPKSGSRSPRSATAASASAATSFLPITRDAEAHGPSATSRPTSSATTSPRAAPSTTRPRSPGLQGQLARRLRLRREQPAEPPRRQVVAVLPVRRLERADSRPRRERRRSRRRSSRSSCRTSGSSRPKLTVTAGVRYERLDNPDNPILNPNHVALDGRLRARRARSRTRTTSGRRAPGSPTRRTRRPPSGSRSAASGRARPGILFSQLFTSNGLVGHAVHDQRRRHGGEPTAPTDPLSPGLGPELQPERRRADQLPGGSHPDGPRRLHGEPQLQGPGDGPRHARRRPRGLREHGRRHRGDLREGEEPRALERPEPRPTTAAVSADQRPAALLDDVRPDPFYGRISTYTTDARSKYEAVTFQPPAPFHQGPPVLRRPPPGPRTRTTTRTSATSPAPRRRTSTTSTAATAGPTAISAGSSAPTRTGTRRGGASGSRARTATRPARRTRRRPARTRTGDGFFNDRPTIDGVHFSRNQFRQPIFSQFDFRLAKTFNIGPVGLTAIASASTARTTGTVRHELLVGNRPDARPPRSASPTASARCRARSSSRDGWTSRAKHDRFEIHKGGGQPRPFLFPHRVIARASTVIG